MKKLIFVDSDGTLKNSKGQISEKTIQVLKELKSRGIEVIITTGRPRYHALKVKENSSASRYIISSNGAEVYDSETDKVIYTNYINKNDVLEIFKILENNNCRGAMNIKDKEVVQDEIKNINQIMLDTPLEEYPDLNSVKQIFVRSDNEKDAKKAYKEIKELSRVRIVNESSYFQTGIIETKGIWFTIANKEVNKALAIEELCKYLDVDITATYGLGNDYNDLEMFDIVNCSIVMENANEDIKQHANIIAKSNDEEGVAKVLEKLFLEVQ